MFESEFLVLFALEAACGAAGGVAVERWRKSGMGRAAAALVGAIGGVVLSWLAGFSPRLGYFVGHIEAAADAMLTAAGGFTPEVLVGAGIAGLMGGAILTFAAGWVFRHGAHRP